MILIQMTGLSGAGKTTLANNAKRELQLLGLAAEVLDGDSFRQSLCKDLGFSRSDRAENIRRIASVGHDLAAKGVIAIISAINPSESVRQDVRSNSEKVRTIWINCDIEVLKIRDTKGLYKRAFLPDEDPQKISNLTGINDFFDIPVNPDLVLTTSNASEEESTQTLVQFILSNIE